jgi:hypothetical protein
VRVKSGWARRCAAAAGAIADALEAMIFALPLAAVQMSNSSDAERRWAIAALITRGIRAR